MPSEAFSAAPSAPLPLNGRAHHGSTARQETALPGKPSLITADASKVTPLEFVKHSRNVFAGPPPSDEYLAILEHIDDCFAANGNPLPGYEERKAERFGLVPHHRLHRVVIARAGEAL